MIKYSKQREVILNNLLGRNDHPTADMVYESVRREQPNISLGTVYRNLAFLAENGQILRISAGSGPDRFDGYAKPHSHFVCRCCGKVVDVDYVFAENIIENASRKFEGSIDEYELRFFGICEVCLSNKKN